MKPGVAAIVIIGVLVLSFLHRKRPEANDTEPGLIEILNPYWHQPSYKPGEFMQLHITVKSNLAGRFKIVLRSDIMRWYTFRDLEAGDVIDTSLVGWAPDHIGIWPTYQDIYLWAGWDKWHAGETTLIRTDKMPDVVIEQT